MKYLTDSDGTIIYRFSDGSGYYYNVMPDAIGGYRDWQSLAKLKGISPNKFKEVDTQTSMTASTLRSHVESSGKAPYFFDAKTMRGFGDTMKNYGVCDTGIIESWTGFYDCWELYRRKPVKCGNQASAYFDKITFRKVNIKKG